MIARDRPRRTGKPPSFELKRFAWGAPDRLELAGTFAGLDAPPADPPVLVLSGAERTHRLPAAADEVAGAPENGRPWRVAFVWQEAPAAFQASTLEFGPGLAVDLPEPDAADAAAGKVALAVRSTRAAPASADEPPGPGVERLRLEAELLTAREELRESRAALRRSEEELSRARADLGAEREDRAADAGRFREGLAMMQASAEEALAAEQSAARQLGHDLKAAIDAADAKEAELRGEFDTAAEVWADSQSASRAEVAALQERLDALAAAGEDAERLRGELAAAGEDAERLRGELAAAREDAERLRGELAAARAEAEETQGRIETARDALEDARAGAERLADRLTVSDVPQDEGS